MKELLCLEGLEGCLLLVGDRRGGRVHRWRRGAHRGAGGNPATHLDFIRRGALAAAYSEKYMFAINGVDCEEIITCADFISILVCTCYSARPQSYWRAVYRDPRQA